MDEIHGVYEWDKAKGVANFEKHAIAFPSMENFDWLNALVTEDDKHSTATEVATSPLDISDLVCITLRLPCAVRGFA